MNARETERIIAFHGMRRGAAHILSGADGTHITLTLRPGAKLDAPPIPKAACLAGLDGTAVRVPLSGGAGRTAARVDPAVILLVADAPGGEIFCAEGARGALDRRAVEALKRPLRALRAGGNRESPPAEAPREAPPHAAEAAKKPMAEREPQEPRAQAAPPAPALPEAPAEKPARAEQRTATHRPEPPQPRSEALQSILSKASELFPPGGGEGGAAAHFASDEPLRGAFVPRPLAVQEERRRRNVIPAGMAGQTRLRDPQWSDAVRELSRPEDAPKPSGVGTAEAAGSLFPEAFPGVSWRRVRYPGTRRYYLEGSGLVNGARSTVYALPGEGYPAQPYRARGYTRFVRDTNGNGYWVKVKRNGNNGER